jgi:hypothetical protein
MFARAPLEIDAPHTSDTLLPLVSLTDTSDLPPGRCFLPFHRAADDTDIHPWRAEFGMLQSRCTAEDHFLAQFAHITRATPALVVQAILLLHLEQQEPHGLGQTTVVWRDLSFIKDHFADYLKIKAEMYENLVKIGKLPESATTCTNSLSVFQLLFKAPHHDQTLLSKHLPHLSPQCSLSTLLALSKVHLKTGVLRDLWTMLIIILLLPSSALFGSTFCCRLGALSHQRPPHNALRGARTRPSSRPFPSWQPAHVALKQSTHSHMPSPNHGIF